MKNLSYILVAGVVLGVIVAAIVQYRKGIWHLLNFFFRPNVFADIAAEDVVRINMKDKNFKEKWETNEQWKTERIKEDKERFLKSTYKLRGRIRYAFNIVALTALCAFGIAYISAGTISISENILLLMQLISAFMILWSIIGQLGFPIQTFSGETLPENIDKLWFFILNIFGIFLLCFTQIYGYFRKG